MLASLRNEKIVFGVSRSKVLIYIEVAIITFRKRDPHARFEINPSLIHGWRPAPPITRHRIPMQLVMAVVNVNCMIQLLLVEPALIELLTGIFRRRQLLGRHDATLIPAISLVLSYGRPRQIPLVMHLSIPMLSTSVCSLLCRLIISVVA